LSIPAVIFAPNETLFGGGGADAFPPGPPFEVAHISRKCEEIAPGRSWQNCSTKKQLLVASAKDVFWGTLLPDDW